MPETVLGLPIHPLIVHATVMILPLTAVAVVLWFLSARFRRWSGVLPLVLTVVSVALAPLTTSSGEDLEDMVGESALVERHAELGEMLIWWCLGMFVVAAAGWLLHRRRDQVTALSVGLMVAAVVASGGTLVLTTLIGHTGAEAAWDGVATSSQDGEDDD